MRTKRGFTLIELLTVIAIIGILAAIVVVNTTSARVRARDTKRKADLKTLQSALESYYYKSQSYPIRQGPSPNWKSCKEKWCVSGSGFYDSPYYVNWGENLWIDGLVEGGYLQAMPLDPINKGDSTDCNIRSTAKNNFFYLYRVTPDAQGYKLMTKLEGDSASMNDAAGDHGIYNDLYEIFNTPDAKNLSHPDIGIIWSCASQP